VPFLYLANDILQNSRRKGLEFVNEFWTVLPALLQEVVDIGDEGVRSAAFRLVWNNVAFQSGAQWLVW
jgi:regulator of Ty1 transposition protein 103